MPYITINGANIFFETFGELKPGQSPVVLIHGSTSTGRSNWSLVAPLLAREHYVIVPDCRGHGKSSNPNLTYSFKEMADDTAELIRTLGFERAHIIGHSNGGNVALVFLLEHPDLVQTAIPQAANAWVSPDLVEKEPPLFDPERVQRDAPQWMEQIILLHGETGGVGYWRDLLRLTVAEIIREPNYTPHDLQAVQRPTLVIQGENDRVNAPFRHAQFIARHIPDSELWVPPGIGHNVHDEIPFEWVEKVLDFLRRRGDPANDLLYRLGQRRYRDESLWVYQVRAERSPDSESASFVDLRLSGQVLTEDQRQAVQELFPDQMVEDRIQVLLTEETPWALVRSGVRDLRRQPGSEQERVSQVLFGEALRILQEQDGWACVRLESDGYLGWVRANALWRCDRATVEEYRQSCSHLVISSTAQAWSEPLQEQPIPQRAKASVAGSEGLAARNLALDDYSPIAGIASDNPVLPLSRLPFGVAVAVVAQRDGFAALRLPDGNTWWVAQTDLLPLSERPQANPAGIEKALHIFHNFVGVPYLWGGRSPFGFDCSGLAQTFWAFLGVQLPRDARQQFQIGEPVDGGLPGDDRDPAPSGFEPGDLLFFAPEDRELLPGEPGAPQRRVTHVGISLGGWEVLNARGLVNQVTIDSLDPHSPRYLARFREELVGGRRHH